MVPSPIHAHTRILYARVVCLVLVLADAHVLTDTREKKRSVDHCLLQLCSESSSKKVDAALMIAIGWPSFATHEAQLVARTWANLQQLEGRFGYKRFPRDGFKNAAENPTRKHYLPAEMKARSSSDWQTPKFFLLLHVLFPTIEF